MLSSILCRNGIQSRCTKFMALAVWLVLPLMMSGTALAHTDPPGSDSTGITLSITAFRNDGTTSVILDGGTVSQCETIKYRATLSWAGGSNAAFERGTWTITTPDGVPHDVTPAPALPCIGGTVDDPNSAANDGRGLCNGAAVSINSALVSYTVSPGDIVGGFIPSSTNLSSAFAHLNAGDLPGVGANTPFALAVTMCDDGAFCNGVETCDPAAGNGKVLGMCVPGTPPVCDDGDACTVDSCNEDTDMCESGPPTTCDDMDACTDDVCNPDTGLCEFTSNTTCDDMDACTDDVCNPDTGLCEFTPNTTCDDMNACTDDVCNPDTGLCEFTPNTTCDDMNACTDDVCNPDTGLCEFTPNTICDDMNACTEDTCDPATGSCVFGPETDCDDGDICTADSCDPATGLCVNTPIPEGEADPSCFPDLICRTPGFWGSHAGANHPSGNSENITWEVIAENGGSLSVCGTTIDNTNVGNSTSALEAMCVSVKGVQERQLVRQLTAAALNCVVSGNDEFCSGNADLNYLMTECNATCDDGTGALSTNECIEQIDCFNNGGDWDDGLGTCIEEAGTCAVGGAYCDEFTTCGLDGPCERADNCHDRDLCPDPEFCFEPPGPAGSPRECRDARKNNVYVP